MATLTISWTAPGSCAGCTYEYRYKLNSNPTYITGGTSNTSIVISSLTDGATYDYGVRTVCGDIRSAWSSAATVTCDSEPPLTATPTATPTSTPTATPSPTPTGSPTPTPTTTPTPTSTPTPTPTSTPVPCVDGVGFEVDVAGQVRYVTCAGITEYVTLGIGPQFISECIENNSLFGVGATISQISYGSPCTVPTPTPTPTATPTPVYVFYRAAEVMDSSISTTYCDNFGSGGQGYLINSPFYTTDATLIAGTTIIYSDYGLTTPVVGSWSLSNITRMAYITESENQSAQNTPTTTNPNGDLLYDGGTYKFMRVDSNGTIISIGNDSCSGGPGGPSEA